MYIRSMYNDTKYTLALQMDVKRAVGGQCEQSSMHCFLQPSDEIVETSKGSCKAARLNRLSQF